MTTFSSGRRSNVPPRLAATRASSDDVDRLRAILDSQRGACDEADYQRFHALDDHLHFAIRQLSGHGVAWSFAYGRASHLERLRRLNLDRPGYIEGAIDEHERVIDAIASNEAVLAAEALRHHLQRAPAQIPELRRRHPNYFELTARIGPAT